MTQDKKLHRHLGISYNAAWRIRHKLMQVMMERDREHPLGGSIQLDDAYLGGERSGGKRGRGAPGKTPFVAAVETNEQGHPLRMKLTSWRASVSPKSPPGRSSTGTGTRVVSDGLAPAFMASPRRAAFMSRWWWVAGKPLSSAPSFDG